MKNIFRIQSKCLLLTYHVPKICTGFISFYLKKEDIIHQLKEILKNKKIQIVEYLVCFESTTKQRVDKQHFEGNSIFRHSHVYLMLDQRIDLSNPFFFDLQTFNDSNESIQFHCNICNLTTYVKDQKLQYYPSQSNREACISYLLKEDTEPYSNLDFSYLCQIRKNRPIQNMVYNSTLEPLKLYQPLKDYFRDNSIKKEFEENDFLKMKRNQRRLLILPYQENGRQKLYSYIQYFFPAQRIQFIDEFRFSDNFQNTDVLVIYNPNDFTSLIDPLLESQRSYIEINNKRIEVPSTVIISILKEKLMNKKENLQYLRERNYLDISELDQDFRLIPNDQKQIIHFNQIINGNNNTIHIYQQNQELLKEINQLKEKMSLLEKRMERLE